jgi:methylamine---glutamate N-methyltransferase subunit B
MGTVDCEGRTTREVNAEIKQQVQRGESHIVVQNPGARHNLGVALLAPVTVQIAGSVGYYCAGMIDGPAFEIAGSAGWGLAESMLNGQVVARGSVGNGAAAAIRGGTVIVHGDAAARLGISMKGGTVVVAGNCGYMAGFMAQKGTLIVCGDAGEAFADSMYETVCYVGGKIAELGNDAVVEAPSSGDGKSIDLLLAKYFDPERRREFPAGAEFKKVVSGRKLWNFDKRDWKTWQEAL